MPTATSTARSAAPASALSAPALLAAALLSIAAVRLVGTLPGAWSRNDFAHYYLSARVLLAGEDPYTASLEPFCERFGFEFDPRIVTGTNPPPLTLLLAGVAWLPPAPAYAVWAMLQLTCLAGLLGALVRRASRGGFHAWRWVAIGLVLNSTAVWSNLHYSQVQLLVAMLIAAAYFDKRQGRPLQAVAAVAVAAGLKIYPAALLPWFVLSGAGGGREVARRTLVAAAVGLSILVVTGPGEWRSFATNGLATVQNSVHGSTSNYSIQSAAMIVTGAVVGRPLPGAVMFEVAALSRVAAAGTLALAYLLVWRLRLPPRRAIGLLCVAMIAASPVCWSHYLTLLILPVWLLWEELGGRRWTAASAAVAVLALACLYSELDAPVPLGELGLARSLLHFYPLVVMLTLAGLLALWRVPKPDAGDCSAV